MPSGNTNTSSNLGPKVAAQVHPLYSLLRPVWEKLAHVREGTGGFLDGTYLVAHPREWLDHSTRQTITDTNTNISTVVTTINPNPSQPSPKLKARRALARYENVASAILESKKAILFREQPTRRVGVQAPPKPAAAPPDPNADPLKPVKPVPPPAPKPEKPSELEVWWENVDGQGTHIDDALPQWWDLAATMGHVALYFDLAPEPDEEVKTAADQPMPYVRVYTPLDVLDWRRNDLGDLVWIKLLEATQTATANDGPSVTTFRIRLVDEVGWKLYDYKSGKYISQGEHGLGKLPVVFLFGKRRALLADIGESVLGDPRNYIDLFNLTSEIRELLRNQTFSFINLPLGSGPDAMSVEAAQTMMGQQTGTMNVLFSALPADILTGDPGNVASYHDEIARVKREIYRDTGVQFDVDSKDAEAQGALELKRAEMTVRVSAYADECQRAEYGLVSLWYRARHGADGGPQKMESDQVQIHYPENFADVPFKDVLDEASAAQSLGMPALFLKELRKAMVTKFTGMGSLDQATLQAIIAAIDAAPDDPTPAEKQRQKMELLTASVKTGQKAPPGAANVEAA